MRHSGGRLTGPAGVGRVKSLMAHRRLELSLTFGIFVAALLVYRFLGPPETPFNNFVRQAQLFLDGRLDLPADIPYLELAVREGKYYIIPPPMPAILILPGVALYGLALNQTLASAVVGAVGASVVSVVAGGVSTNRSAQIWLTILFIFGTVYWYAAANGGVWFFSHTVAVLFLFLAIYATLARQNPFLAGLFLGAAYWSRLPTVLALPFFIIMFSDQWLPSQRTGSLVSRINVKPLLWLGFGVGIFVLLNFVYNYLRFDTPLDASYYFRKPEIWDEPWFNHGPLHITYIPRHLPIIFEKLPIIQTEAPYILPSWGGMAIWATTPACLYALFAGIRSRPVIVFGSALILITVAVITSRAIAGAWDLGWAQRNIPFNLTAFPFLLLIGLAVVTAIRDGNKLVLACWSAIIPISLAVFSHGATGFAQFGYRFSLDFLPFLFLLTAVGIGERIRWHHKLLILLGVIVNLWGVLWIYQFQEHEFLGLQWVGW